MDAESGAQGGEFYNTTNLCDATLILAIRQAKTQTDKILALFKRYPHRAFTPFEVQAATRLNGAPITSIRRSMTDLTSDGVLFKSHEMRDGPYGKPSHTWRLAFQLSPYYPKR